MLTSVETLLRSRGVSDLPDVIETTSPTFGRSYLRLSDAIWIISRGVVADDLRSGELVELPIDVDIVTGPVGLTMRAHAAATPPIQIIRDALRAVAKEIGLTTPDNSPAKSQEPSDSELSDRGTDSVESGYD